MSPSPLDISQTWDSLAIVVFSSQEALETVLFVIFQSTLDYLQYLGKTGNRQPFLVELWKTHPTTRHSSKETSMYKQTNKLVWKWSAMMASTAIFLSHSLFWLLLFSLPQQNTSKPCWWSWLLWFRSFPTHSTLSSSRSVEHATTPRKGPFCIVDSTYSFQPLLSFHSVGPTSSYPDSSSTD